MDHLCFWWGHAKILIGALVKFMWSPTILWEEIELGAMERHSSLHFLPKHWMTMTGCVMVCQSIMGLLFGDIDPGRPVRSLIMEFDRIYRGMARPDQLTHNTPGMTFLQSSTFNHQEWREMQAVCCQRNGEYLESLYGFPIMEMSMDGHADAVDMDDDDDLSLMADVEANALDSEDGDLVLMEDAHMGRTEQFTEVSFSAPRTEGEIVTAAITGHTQTQLIA